MKRTLFASVLALAASGAQAAVIDSFGGTGPIDQNAPLNNFAAGNSSSGFARLLQATTSGDFTNVQIDTATNPGVYAHSQGAGVTGFSQIDYTLGGFDLTEAGTQNAVRVELAGADLSGVFGLIVDGVSISLTTNEALLASGLSFPAFGDFVFTDFAGVDFTNVNSVSVFIDGNNQDALDASIDLISTTCTDLTSSGGSTPNNVGTCAAPPPPGVPSPAPLALMAAGLVGLAGVRRLKK